MKASDFLLGSRSLLDEADIVETIKDSKNYRRELDEGDNPVVLPIFKTSKQRTWLVATNRRLYCILDDNRKEKPRINWSMSKKNIAEDGDIVLEIQSRDKTEKTGLVDIGPGHKNWLYSKNLFADRDIADKIRDIVQTKMIE